ncbi:hypothetical protein CYY_009868 [Polysphondylium violaceum]|uniref:FNIP repeat-containing protein n=1 Tax=Polysphondylium violaceum TaxID=133409 RepID=A0A8J4PLJ9_9MYCE|nr:hypothetical protein CYY_009868 [Polysphondylium violaceum]
MDDNLFNLVWRNQSIFSTIKQHLFYNGLRYNGFRKFVKDVKYLKVLPKQVHVYVEGFYTDFIGDLEKNLISGVSINHSSQLEFVDHMPPVEKIVFLNLKELETLVYPIPDTVVLVRFVYFDGVHYKAAIEKLPASVKSITFDFVSREEFVIPFLPSFVTSLEIGKLSQSIEPGFLPPNLHTLVLNDFNLPLQNLPQTITHLSLLRFNQPIQPNTLPVGLKTLIFKFFFNQEIQEHSIPSGVTCLALGESFNKVIKPNTLPASLLTLDFGGSYNQALEIGSLPPLITNLNFKDSFNQPIGVSVLPPRLKSLDLGFNYWQRIETDALPTTLVSLKGMEPNSNYPFEKLVHLQTLSFQSFRKSRQIKLPDSLKALDITPFKRVEFEFYPNNLQELVFDYWGKYPLIPGSLPRVNKLTLTLRDSIPLTKGVVPNGVKTLILELEGSNCKIPRGSIPASVTKLKFKKLHYQLDFESIPNTVRYLTLPVGFKQSLQSRCCPIPDNIIKLKIHIDRVYNWNTDPPCDAEKWNIVYAGLNKFINRTDQQDKFDYAIVLTNFHCSYYGPRSDQQRYFDLINDYMKRPSASDDILKDLVLVQKEDSDQYDDSDVDQEEQYFTCSSSDDY